MAITKKGCPFVNDLKVFTGRAHADFARDICRHLGVLLGEAEIFKFSNDNTFIKINESVRDDDIFVVQTSCAPVNDGFMELMIMIDALNRASVGRITAVLPYFPYSRSDKKDQPRIPITARLIADMLEGVGVDRVLTMDLHAAQIQGFFKIPVDHLTAIPILAEYFRKKGWDDLVVVAPDAGGAKRARSFADWLKAPMAIVDKRRIGNDEEAVVDHLIGEVGGKRAILVDDEVSSGRSLAEGCRTLLRKGAKEVYAAVTHPVLSGNAAVALTEAGLKELVVTDSIPIPLGKRHPIITVLSVAPLFAAAISRIHSGGSVSTLFEDPEGQAKLFL